MRRYFLPAALVVLTAGCDCQDYIPEPGHSCRHHDQALMVERTSPYAPPLVVCRCPVQLIPEGADHDAR